jgi:hypothetical protein
MNYGAEPTALQEAALEERHHRRSPEDDDRLIMDLEPYPDSQVY